MKNILIFLCLGFSSLCMSADNSEQITLDNTIKEYRIYSLARCIEANYEKMGVDFKQLPLTDITIGFIDIDGGLGFGLNGLNSKPNNVLDDYIEMKTGDFYKPKHESGDLASSNLVVYNCVDFYESEELKNFLKEQIPLQKQICSC